MKKLFKAVPLIMLICVSCLCGCGKKREKLAGEDLISALRKEAAGYNSGRYYFTNVESGVTEKVFSFYFTEDGKEVYLLEETDGSSNYSAEYSDGSLMQTLDNGNADMIEAGSKDYVAYTKKDPHPFSSGQLYFFEPSYVAAAEQNTDADGNTIYIYSYDTEKMNAELGSNFTDFGTSYAFDKNGNFAYFLQHNVTSGTDANGGEAVFSVTYEIFCDEINAVNSIENPCNEIPVGAE